MVKIKQESINADRLNMKNVTQELHQLRSKVKDLSSLIEVSIIINSALELDELIELVMEKAQAVMKAEASSVMLLNEEKNILECAVALGSVGEQVKKNMQLKLGEGIAGWVAQHGEPQIVPDVLTDPRFNPTVDSDTGFKTRSILAAPLIVKNKTIGVAEVINRRDGEAFNNEDLELFSTFCRQVAMAIENARMYKMKLEAQKLEQQLEAAKFIQQSFMPESFPSFPEGTISIAAKSLPATSIGGDFFDVVKIDDDTVGVAVGDVTGKGIPAALYMARFVSDFRIYSQIYKYPSQVLKALNKILVDRSRRGMFVTFQYGLLNTATGRFTYANAGHIPFIKVNPEKGECHLIRDGKTVPLGIIDSFSVTEKSLQLKQSEFIILITDGIIEAKNKSKDFYTLKRTLNTLLKEHSTVEALVANLLNDVQRFVNDAEQSDDLTIVAFRWR
ncbi:MAG: SpoIIE family protein phosphatase [bacterium]